MFGLGRKAQRSARVVRKLAVRIGRAPRIEGTGSTLDLSEGGLALTSAVQHPIGTRVSLELSLPGEAAWCCLQGVVMWSRSALETGGPLPRVGVRLVAKPTVYTRFVREWLAAEDASDQTGAASPRAGASAKAAPALLRSPRYRVRLEAQLTSAGRAALDAIVLNVSRGGLMLATRVSARTGLEVVVAIGEPGLPAMRCNAVIAWSRPSASPTGPALIGLAVRPGSTEFARLFETIAESVTAEPSRFSA